MNHGYRATHQESVGSEQRDVTSRPGAAFLAATIERAPVGIAHFDHSGRFLFVNPQLCAIFGLTRDELLRKTFQEISFADDLPRCLHLTAQLAAGAIPRYSLEKRFHRPDGSFVYVRVIVTAMQAPGGAVESFLGVVEDLTEQWGIEEARRAAEEKLRLGLDASRTGIYQYDFRRQGLDWSNGLSEVFGFPKEETLHSLERLLGAIHSDDLPDVLSAYQRCATAGADLDIEFRIVLPDGRVRWICDRARMTLDADGKAHYLTGACIDVTSRREAENERAQLLERERAARADAERAARTRDEVLAVVAHDLRNPVHTIMLGAGAMAELALSDEDRARQLALVQRSARRMDRLIRDLLDVTGLETGKLSVHPTRVDVAGFVDEAVEAVRHVAEGISVSAELAADLPLVNADRARIVQVLGNLLGNAVKFTPSGGRVCVRAGRDAGGVRISVEDSGRGIPPEHLSHVFDRYWQAERGFSQGVGLGLAIVRGIVELHGGRVEVSSAVGRGSTFSFTLPAT